MPIPKRKNNTSFVLVVVLGMLVLIIILVVGFLGHVASQSKTSTSYRDQTGTLLLGDVAVNLVKAQIDAATTASQGGTNLWASQPGAIRTLSALGTTATYKLYSSPTLLETATGAALKTKIAADLPTATASAASDWSSSALWTDLNAPAVKADGTYAYPIIDVVNDNTDLPSGSTAASPFASGSFNIDSGNTLGATRSATGQYPLPMPVRWLYVLKQGQIIAPDTTSTDTALTFNSATPKPTSANPIIGRIAFWTDDDTCRVNINTASNGAFWDIPRFTSPDDVRMSTNQPVSKEYQRYPGHVATTTLTNALPELAGIPETAIGLTPRYYTGGSQGGTVPTSGTSVALGSPGKTNRLYVSVDELLFDPPSTNSAGRLVSPYLSRKQVETAKFFLTAHSRAPELNLFGAPRVAMWPISSLPNAATNSYQTTTDQLIAFCASTPGVAVTNTYYFTRAPHDNSILFGGYLPGFAGSNSTSTDINLPRNVALLNYLDYFTSQPLPGNLGGTSTFDSKYTLNQKRQILTEIFDYIRTINERDPQLDPFVGGAFPPANTVAANVPYSGYEANQISTYNGFSQGQILPTYYTNWGTYGYGRFPGIVASATLDFVGVGRGANGVGTTPLVKGYRTNNPSSTTNCYPVGQSQCATMYNNTNMFSTNYAPSSFAYDSTAAGSYTNYGGTTNYFPYNTYATALPLSTNAVTPAGFAPVGGVPPNNTTAVQAVFWVDLFDPAVGFGMYYPAFTITVSGLQSLTLNGTPLKFPYASECLYNGNVQYGGKPGNVGGIKSGFDILFHGLFKTGLGGTGNPTIYPIFSNIVNVANTSSTMQLGGGGIVTVKVYPLLLNNPNPPSSVVPIHTYSIDLSQISSSSGNLPVPGYSQRPYFGSIRTPIAAPYWTNGLPMDRYDMQNSQPASKYFDANSESVQLPIDSFNDTVVSMVPSTAYGDYRMLADTNTPSAAFVPHVNYGTGTNLAYGLEYPSGQVGRGSAQGTIISGASYYRGTTYGSPTTTVNPGAYGATPMVPCTVTSPKSGSAGNPSTGVFPDYDNGFGNVPDGPYINKPDEGVVYNLGVGTHGEDYRPYIDNGNVGLTTNFSSFFSPERQATSPVMFGSLPTGAPVKGSAPKPWQTLLFQPGQTGHAGLANPKDEYLLDLFWMPQSEPYAISEPFSTAGKVNLNYQILPFTYIDRSTAIQSVLSTEKVAAVSSSLAGTYKQSVADFQGTAGLLGMTTPARSALSMSEVDGTLRPFAAKFGNMDFFHAPAEICDVYLVPQTLPSGESAWSSDSVAQNYFYGSDFALVGDNTREKPYADIYARITTKSNSFTIYYRVQTLKNPPTAGSTTWTEGQGAVVGDFRGSTTLERYIDPNDLSIPDYTANTTAANLETHYKWRVVENTRFSP